LPGFVFGISALILAAAGLVDTLGTLYPVDDTLPAATKWRDWVALTPDPSPTRSVGEGSRAVPAQREKVRMRVAGEGPGVRVPA